MSCTRAAGAGPAGGGDPPRPRTGVADRPRPRYPLHGGAAVLGRGGGTPHELCDPLLAELYGLRRAEPARLETPLEPKAIEERGESDGGETQIDRRREDAAHAAADAGAARCAAGRQQLREQAAQQVHVVLIGLAMHALHQARMAVQAPE